MTIVFQITLAIAINAVLLVHGKTFWEHEKGCNDIKNAMDRDETVENATQVQRCIILCFKETTLAPSIANAVTPDECFTYLVEPYITNVVNTTIPTQNEIDDCLAATDRSECSDILFYYFSKWYKTKYDTSYDREFAELLFEAWAHNPDVPKPVPYPGWEFAIAAQLSRLAFETAADITKAKKLTSLSDPLQFPVIHNELQRYCYKPITPETELFCKLRIVVNFAKKVRTLACKKETYLQDLQKYKEAIKLNMIALSALYEEIYASQIPPSADADKAKLFDSKLKELADLSKARDTKSLLSFLQFMPESYILNQACKQTTFPRVGQRSCMMVEVQEQLLIYAKMVEKRKSPTGKKAVAINFSLNMRSIITELRGEEAFSMLLEQRYDSVTHQEEIKNLIEGKFDQLKGYFTKLQSFNMQKASADVAYIKGMIDHYRGKVTTATTNVGEHVGGVLKAAVIAKGAEVAYNIINLAVTIAQACNPFDIILNGGSATDIMDATSKLSTSISELVGAVALKRDWTNALSLINEISRGLKKNSEFLGAVGKIVAGISLENFPDDDEFEESKSTFLRLYNAYTPEVDAVKLARLETKLDTTVSSACEIIDSVDTTGAAEYVAYVRDNLYCPKAAESINVMVTLYQEIYEHQFELIESMATYLQSATGYHAAKEMVTLAGEPVNEEDDADEQTQYLRAQVIMAHTTYEMQKQNAVQDLCNCLEYQEGGKAPEVCKKAPANIPTLLSYIPKQCTSVDKYVSIPISTSSRIELGKIDIKALYKGEEVSFSVPDYQWLKDNKWIEADDNFDALYIRNFHIFLPSVTKARSTVRVTAEPIGENKFTSNGVKYSAIPIRKFRLDYEQGEGFFPCSGRKIDHPYSICKTQRLPDVCVMSESPSYDDPLKFYPSIFARFLIKAKGVTQEQTPDPTSPLDIKARVNLCIFEQGKRRKKRNSGDHQIPGCCEGNTYWHRTEMECQNCGSDSKPNLKGYYCEKNKDAIY